MTKRPDGVEGNIEREPEPQEPVSLGCSVAAERNARLLTPMTLKMRTGDSRARNRARAARRRRPAARSDKQKG